MASSSVSQESLDRDDYDFVGRRGAGRIRSVRGRGWSGPRTDSMESADMEATDILPPSGPLADLGEIGEHDSPTRSASRLKDKRGRPIHLHKGKTAKDKRKLREKRRSTGVVHLASTESTGDSLDEDEKLLEARRNTTYNEVIDADNPQTPEEDRKGYGQRTRNKSPSDLEADLEDNQDYDSTVSQSETNLTMIGRVPTSQPGKVHVRMRNPITDSHITMSKSSLSSVTTTPAGTDPDSCKEDSSSQQQQPPRPMSYPSRFCDQSLNMETYMTSSATAANVSDSSAITTSATDINSPLKSSLSSSRSSSQKETTERVPREHVRWRDRSAGDTGVMDRMNTLEKALDEEKQENQRLREMLLERDALINDLRREVALLHKDLEVADEEYDGVKQENQALLRALASLAVDC